MPDAVRTAAPIAMDSVQKRRRTECNQSNTENAQQRLNHKAELQ